jgi:phage shock protein PspC (stress-responsive transcriptional regulator)
MVAARDATYRTTMSDATPDTNSTYEPRTLRRSDQRLLGGVAGGVAQRFDIDVRLVRVAFVLSTLLWGLGAVAYLVLWVVVPSEPRVNDDAPPTKRLRVALLSGAFVVAFVLLSAWRPLRFVGPSVALLWVIFLAGLAVVAIRTPSRRLTLRRLLGFGLLGAMSGFIVVTGAFLGFVASTGVPFAGGVGLHAYHPSSIATTQHQYRTTFGETNVDLSKVTFPVTGFRLDVSAAVGEAIVTIPADVVVSLQTNVGAGTIFSLQWNGGQRGSAFDATPRGLAPGALKRAPHLTLSVQVGVGKVIVYRAAPTSR